MRTISLLLAAALGCGIAPAHAQTAVSFDGFLAGLDAACDQTAEFKAWQTSLVGAHNPGPDQPRGTVVRPAGVGAGLGTSSGVDMGEYVEVKVPATGTFRGLALSAIVFSFGKENGIYGYAVEFAEPRATVEKALAAAVERGNAKMAKVYAETGASTGFDFKGRVALYCDFSN
ncbi:MAG: hypothetical protein ABTQ29_07760 [Siculibacillus sp.]